MWENKKKKMRKLQTVKNDMIRRDVAKVVHIRRQLQVMVTVFFSHGGEVDFSKLRNSFENHFYCCWPWGGDEIPPNPHHMDYGSVTLIHSDTHQETITFETHILSIIKILFESLLFLMCA